MGKLVMGYWDCPVCGNKGITGDVMNCPACGRARGDVQFYLKNGADGEEREANERSDLDYLNEEQTAAIGKNPDWYCSFCNSLNRDHAAFCSNCGASRESSESNYFDQLKKKKEAEQAEKAAQGAQTHAAARPASKRSLLILIVAVIAIVGMFMYMNGDKTQGNLEVTGVSWARSIPVEQYQMFSESDWRLPEGAELTSQREELHHYDQVLDHYEDVEVQRSRQVVDHYETYYTYSDNGNGTFEEISHERPVYTTEYYTETVSQPVYRSVPRYQTKYYYNIWRWTQVRTENASGEDHSPFWPELNLAEDEREGSPRAELYVFTVKNEKDVIATYSLAESDWMNIKVGSRLNITSKRTGSNPWITDSDGNQIAPVQKR